MKLVAIYLGNYGIFQNQLLSFSSDYKVIHNVKSEDRISFRIEHEQRLPKNFFSTSPSVHGCVSSVSAIIGKNGSGKTTISRLLCSLSQAGDLLKNSKIVLILEIAKRLLAYASYPVDKISVEVSGEEKIPINSLIMNDLGRRPALPFKFFYYSPHYTTEQYGWDMGNEGDSVFNISTTWLMHHPEGNSETLLRDGVSNLRIFDVDEKIRVLEFCEVYRREFQNEDKVIGDSGNVVSQPNSQIKIDIPTPLMVSIAPYSEGVIQAINELNKFVEKKREEESGIQTKIFARMKPTPDALHDPVGEFLRSLAPYLKESLSCSDFFTRVFIAYVARYLQECGIMGSVFPEIEILPGSYLSALKSFVLSHESHKAIDPKDVITFFKSNIPPLNGEIDQDNSRGKKKPYPYAKEFFTCLSKICELQGKKDANRMPLVQCFAGGEMNCRLTNKNVTRLLYELVRLHGLTEIFSPFLTFDILPKMSSGEMAFLSMFARLYRFVWDKTNPGDEVMIFLDEAETTLHPEWQRRLVGYFIRFFEVFIPDRHYQLVFASHSPVLLSDIPVGNCCFVERIEHDTNGVRKIFARRHDFEGAEDCQNTFGANCYDLFRSAFIMKNGAIGEFSSSIIGNLLNNVAKRRLWTDGKNIKTNDSPNSDIELTRKLIGDRVLVRYFNVLKDQGLI